MGGDKAADLLDAIESDILTGRFAPGERLDEQNLARRFGVSRTPVREALLRLQASGLVQFQKNRGTFVAQLSSADVLEMYELRPELEGICGRLAAQRGVPDTILELGRTLQECERAEQAKDLPAYYRANDRFHAAIYAMCGNRLLQATVSSLYTKLARFRHLQMAEENRITESLSQHRAIAAAVIGRDAAQAELLLREHAATRGELFIRFLNALMEDRVPPRPARAAPDETPPTLIVADATARSSSA